MSLEKFVLGMILVCSLLAIFLILDFVIRRIKGLAKETNDEGDEKKGRPASVLL